MGEYIVGNACCNADAREKANKKCKPKGDAEVTLAGTKNLGWLLGGDHDEEYYDNLGCNWKQCERGYCSNKRGAGRPNCLECECQENVDSCMGQVENGVKWYRT